MLTWCVDILLYIPRLFCHTSSSREPAKNHETPQIALHLLLPEHDNGEQGYLTIVTRACQSRIQTVIHMRADLVIEPELISDFRHGTVGISEHTRVRHKAG